MVSNHSPINGKGTETRTPAGMGSGSLLKDNSKDRTVNASDLERSCCLWDSMDTQEMYVRSLDNSDSSMELSPDEMVTPSCVRLTRGKVIIMIGDIRLRVTRPIEKIGLGVKYSPKESINYHIRNLGRTLCRQSAKNETLGSRSTHISHPKLISKKSYKRAEVTKSNYLWNDEGVQLVKSIYIRKVS